jgi:hypothetical protein
MSLLCKRRQTGFRSAARFETLPDVGLPEQARNPIIPLLPPM